MIYLGYVMDLLFLVRTDYLDLVRPSQSHPEHVFRVVGSMDYQYESVYKMQRIRIVFACSRWPKHGRLSCREHNRH